MPASRTHYRLRGPARRRASLARVILAGSAREQRPVTVAFTSIRGTRCVRTLEVFDIIDTSQGYTVITGMDHYAPRTGGQCVTLAGEQCITRVRAHRIRWIHVHRPGYHLHHPWPLSLA